MHQGSRVTRRTVISGLAGGITTLALTGAAPVLGQRSSASEERWVSLDGALTVTYDTKVWSDDRLSTEPSNTFSLGTAAYGQPRYWLSFEHGTAKWASADDASANAQAAWFSQGMNGSVVTTEFTSDTGYGWVHYADFQGDPRTVTVLQYELDGEGGMTSVGISIDAEAFETLNIADVLDAATLNDDPVSVVTTQRKLIRAIEDAFAA